MEYGVVGGKVVWPMLCFRFALISLEFFTYLFYGVSSVGRSALLAAVSDPARTRSL
jgi:hypothetical protein